VLAARRGPVAWQSARDDEDALVRHVAAIELGVTTKVA
jgi:hypothetical protein